jgi:von Willebrand factor type A domain
LTWLTPAAAFVASAALLPLAAAAAGAVRVRRVRRALRLSTRGPRALAARLVPAAASIALLGAAAAQPVLQRSSGQRLRAGAQVLFVLDTSRSMAASATASSATRLERAAAAAKLLRAAIPDVEAGVATLTDRVLPNLLPVADAAAFDATVDDTVGIEAPPPRVSAIRATTYEALNAIRAGNLFAPTATRRIVVLLTDGESQQFSAPEVGRGLIGIRLLAVRFWSARESIFGTGSAADAAYRPDPTGGELLRELAFTTRGLALDESRLGAAASALRGLAEIGPTIRAADQERRSTPLAPYVAALALLPLAYAAIRKA